MEEETPRFAKEFEVVWKTTDRRIDHINFEYVCDIAEHGRKAIGKYTNERFLVVALDLEKRYIGESQINAGDSDMSVVDITALLRHIIMVGGKKIVIFHNHPGCGPEPSMPDVMLTKAVVMLCAFLKIEVLDHIIIGEDDYYSFKESPRKRRLLTLNPATLAGFR